YLLMPLLAYLFAIRPTWLRRGSIVVVAALVPLGQPILIPAMFGRNDGHILNSIQYFLAGMLLADVWVVEWQNALPAMNAKSIAWQDFVWLAALGFIVCGPPHHTRYERMTLAPAIFVMYLAMFKSVWPRRLMRVEWITLIGGMCY